MIRIDIIGEMGHSDIPTNNMGIPSVGDIIRIKSNYNDKGGERVVFNDYKVISRIFLYRKDKGKSSKDSNEYTVGLIEDKVLVSVLKV